MESYCKKITDILWDNPAAETLIEKAAGIVTEIIGVNFDRDHIRTVSMTDGIKNYDVSPPLGE
jgi:hypothetical protein